MKHDTAILLFSESPYQEAQRKPLGHDIHQSSTVFGALNQKMEQVAKATGLPVFTYQCTVKGASFGKQLSYAIGQVFDRNFDKIICIGNDCPAITTTLLLQAAIQLQDNESVLGADQRGGAYLIGLSRYDFDALTFQQLPWISPHLFGALSILCHNALLLPSLPDIHSAKDLHDYAIEQPTLRSFIQFLIQFLLSPNAILRGFACIYVSPQFLFRSLRAPPFCLN